MPVEWEGYVNDEHHTKDIVIEKQPTVVSTIWFLTKMEQQNSLEVVPWHRYNVTSPGLSKLVHWTYTYQTHPRTPSPPPLHPGCPTPGRWWSGPPVLPVMGGGRGYHTGHYSWIIHTPKIHVKKKYTNACSSGTKNSCAITQGVWNSNYSSPWLDLLYQTV